MNKFFKEKIELLKSRICNSKQQAWHASEWQTLLRNSDDYLKIMDLAYQNKIYSQVLHNGHIAVELVMKSAISRQYGRHPHGHEIRKLTNVEVNGSRLLIEINKDLVDQRHFSMIYTAWKMHYRYIKKNVQPAEAIQYLNAFKEAYKWTRVKYCQ